MLSCICRRISEDKIRQCARDAQGVSCPAQKLVYLYYGKPDCSSCKHHIDEVIKDESIRVTPRDN